MQCFFNEIFIMHSLATEVIDELWNECLFPKDLLQSSLDRSKFRPKCTEPSSRDIALKLLQMLCSRASRDHFLHLLKLMSSSMSFLENFSAPQRKKSSRMKTPDSYCGLTDLGVTAHFNCIFQQ